MTLADLESYESSFKDPVNITLRNGNYTIYNPPPPSSGVVLDFILAILDGILMPNGGDITGNSSLCLSVCPSVCSMSLAQRRCILGL